MMRDSRRRSPESSRRRKRDQSRDSRENLTFIPPQPMNNESNMNRSTNPNPNPLMYTPTHYPDYYPSHPTPTATATATATTRTRAGDASDRDRRSYRDQDRPQERDRDRDRNQDRGQSWQQYQQHDRSVRQRAPSDSSGSFSSSSVASSLLDISRHYPTKTRYGGFISTFWKAPSERRVRRRKSGRAKKRRVLYFGNSSSSSVNSDMAYGSGYIRRSKSREFKSKNRTTSGGYLAQDGKDRDRRSTKDHERGNVAGPSRPGGPKRDKTDEEILAIGRQLSDIARKQNEHDVRTSGMIKASGLAVAAAAVNEIRKKRRDTKKRGIGSSKPSHGAYSDSSDDSDWEDASDEEGGFSDAESALAYGSVVSHALPPSRHSFNPAMSAAVGAIAGAGIASIAGRSGTSSRPAESLPARNIKKSSVVDPRLFGPQNSLRGMINTPCGFGQGQPVADHQQFNKLRRAETEPIYRGPGREVPSGPTSEPNRFDAAAVSAMPAQQDLPYRSRPAPIPLQQPSPKVPVSSKVYRAEKLEEESKREPARHTHTRSEETGLGSGIKLTGLAAAAAAAVALASERKSKREARREERRAERQDALPALSATKDLVRDAERRDVERKEKDSKRAGVDATETRDRDRDSKRRDKEPETETEVSRSSKRDSYSSKYLDERDHKRHSRHEEDDTPRKRREKTVDHYPEAESSRKSKRSDGERERDRERDRESRSEVSRSSRRDSRKHEDRDGSRRDEQVAGKAIEKYQPSTKSSAPDPFQFQVSDGAFSTSRISVATAPARPLTPAVVTIDREPNFDDEPPRVAQSDTRLSRRDSFETERKTENYKKPAHDAPQKSDSRRNDYEYGGSDTRNIYEKAKHSTAPIAAATVASAVAIEMARSRERRWDEDYSQAPRDPVQEEADRYYREMITAQKIAAEEKQSRSATPDKSIVNKYDETSQPSSFTIVTPPEMEEAKSKEVLYEVPDADVRIDNKIYPEELHKFQASNQSSTVFTSRDPSCERERPVLNLVYPTPVPSRQQTPSISRGTSDSGDKSESGAKDKDRGKDKDKDKKKKKKKKSASREDSVDDYVYGPQVEHVKSAPPTVISSGSKSVTWGENSTKSFEVERPESRADSEPAGGKAEYTDKSRPRLDQTSQWGMIATAIAGSSSEPAGEPEVKGSSSNKKASSDVGIGYRDRSGMNRGDFNDDARSEPPIPGPKPVGPPAEKMPGGFADDIEFAATLAAGLKDTGFDPNIVIDDPAYRRRDSPPHSSEPNGDGWNHASFSDVVTDLTSKQKAVSEPGFFSEPMDMTRENPTAATDDWEDASTKLSKKDRKKLEKEAKRRSVDVNEPFVSHASETTTFDDFAEGQSSKKEKKKLDKAKRQSMEVHEPLPAESFQVVEFEDASENQLSKKEKKKLEKAKRQSTEFPNPFPLESSQTPPFEDASENQLSKKEKKKLEKAKRQSMEFPDPLPLESSRTPEFEDAPESQLSQKEQRKRDKEARADEKAHDTLTDYKDTPRDDETRAREVYDAEWDDSSKKKSRKSRKSRDFDDDTSSRVSAHTDYADDKSTIRVVEADEAWDTPKKSRSKSKRDSVGSEIVPYSATASEVGERDGSSKRSSKSKRRSGTDVDDYGDDPPDRRKDSWDHREVSSVVSESRGDERRRERRSKRSSLYDDDDAKSIASAPGSSRKSKRSSLYGDEDLARSSVSLAGSTRRGKDKDIDKIEKRSTGLFATLFKGNSKEDSKKLDKESFLDNAGTLGAGVGLATAAIVAGSSRPNAAHTSFEKERKSRDEAKSSPSRSFDEFDPEIAPRAIKPAIDPQYGDLLPLPPSEPGSPKTKPEETPDLPALPDSRPDTPPEERSLKRDVYSQRRRKSVHEAPIKSPSSTAIPISLRLGQRHSTVPGSPGHYRSPPSVSPVTTPDATRRAARMSWDSSREFKPLYLLEHSRQGSAEAIPQGDLPALPPSEPSEPPSRESPALSFTELDMSSGEVVYKELNRGDLADIGLRINTDLAAASLSQDIAGSQETTPKATVKPDIPVLPASWDVTEAWRSVEADPVPVDSMSKDRSSYLLNSAPSSAKSNKTVASVGALQSPLGSTPTKKLMVESALADMADDLTSADEHFSDALEGPHSDTFEEARDWMDEVRPSDAIVESVPVKITEQVAPGLATPAMAEESDPEEWKNLSAKERKKAKKARKNRELALVGGAAATAAAAAVVAPMLTEEAKQTEEVVEPLQTEVFEPPKKGKKVKKGKKALPVEDTAETAAEPKAEETPVTVDAPVVIEAVEESRTIDDPILAGTEAEQSLRDADAPSTADPNPEEPPPVTVDAAEELGGIDVPILAEAEADKSLEIADAPSNLLDENKAETDKPLHDVDAPATSPSQNKTGDKIPLQDSTNDTIQEAAGESNIEPITSTPKDLGTKTTIALPQSDDFETISKKSKKKKKSKDVSMTSPEEASSAESGAAPTTDVMEQVEDLNQTTVPPCAINAPMSIATPSTEPATSADSEDMWSAPLSKKDKKKKKRKSLQVDEPLLAGLEPQSMESTDKDGAKETITEPLPAGPEPQTTATDKDGAKETITEPIAVPEAEVTPTDQQSPEPSPPSEPVEADFAPVTSKSKKKKKKSSQIAEPLPTEESTSVPQKDQLQVATETTEPVALDPPITDVASISEEPAAIEEAPVALDLASTTQEPTEATEMEFAAVSKSKKKKKKSKQLNEPAPTAQELDVPMADGAQSVVTEPPVESSMSPSQDVQAPTEAGETEFAPLTKGKKKKQKQKSLEQDAPSSVERGTTEPPANGDESQPAAAELTRVGELSVPSLEATEDDFAPVSKSKKTKQSAQVFLPGENDENTSIAADEEPVFTLSTLSTDQSVVPEPVTEEMTVVTQEPAEAAESDFAPVTSKSKKKKKKSLLLEDKIFDSSKAAVEPEEQPEAQKSETDLPAEIAKVIIDQASIPAPSTEPTEADFAPVAKNKKKKKAKRKSVQWEDSFPDASSETTGSSTPSADASEEMASEPATSEQPTQKQSEEQERTLEPEISEPLFSQGDAPVEPTQGEATSVEPTQIDPPSTDAAPSDDAWTEASSSKKKGKKNKKKGSQTNVWDLLEEKSIETQTVESADAQLAKDGIEGLQEKPIPEVNPETAQIDSQQTLEANAAEKPLEVDAKDEWSVPSTNKKSKKKKGSQSVSLAEPEAPEPAEKEAVEPMRPTEKPASIEESQFSTEPGSAASAETPIEDEWPEAVGKKNKKKKRQSLSAEASPADQQTTDFPAETANTAAADTPVVAGNLEAATTAVEDEWPQDTGKKGKKKKKRQSLTTESVPESEIPAEPLVEASTSAEPIPDATPSADPEAEFEVPKKNKKNKTKKNSLAWEVDAPEALAEPVLEPSNVEQLVGVDDAVKNGDTRAAQTDTSAAGTDAAVSSGLNDGDQLDKEASISNEATDVKSSEKQDPSDSPQNSDTKGQAGFTGDENFFTPVKLSKKDKRKKKKLAQEETTAETNVDSGDQAKETDASDASKSLPEESKQLSSISGEAIAVVQQEQLEPSTGHSWGKTEPRPVVEPAQVSSKPSAAVSVDSAVSVAANVDQSGASGAVDDGTPAQEEEADSGKVGADDDAWEVGLSKKDKKKMKKGKAVDMEADVSSKPAKETLVSEQAETTKGENAAGDSWAEPVSKKDKKKKNKKAKQGSQYDDFPEQPILSQDADDSHHADARPEDEKAGPLDLATTAQNTGHTDLSDVAQRDVPSGPPETDTPDLVSDKAIVAESQPTMDQLDNAESSVPLVQEEPIAIEKSSVLPSGDSEVPVAQEQLADDEWSVPATSKKNKKGKTKRKSQVEALPWDEPTPTTSEQTTKNVPVQDNEAAFPVVTTTVADLDAEAKADDKETEASAEASANPPEAEKLSQVLEASDTPAPIVVASPEPLLRAGEDRDGQLQDNPANDTWGDVPQRKLSKKDKKKKKQQQADTPQDLVAEPEVVKAEEPIPAVSVDEPSEEPAVPEAPPAEFDEWLPTKKSKKDKKRAAKTALAATALAATAAAVNVADAVTPSDKDEDKDQADSTHVPAQPKGGSSWAEEMEDIDTLTIAEGADSSTRKDSQRDNESGFTTSTKSKKGKKDKDKAQDLSADDSPTPEPTSAAEPPLIESPQAAAAETNQQVQPKDESVLTESKAAVPAGAEDEWAQATNKKGKKCKKNKSSSGTMTPAEEPIPTETLTLSPAQDAVQVTSPALPTEVSPQAAHDESSKAFDVADEWAMTVETKGKKGKKRTSKGWTTPADQMPVNEPDDNRSMKIPVVDAEMTQVDQAPVVERDQAPEVTLSATETVAESTAAPEPEPKPEVAESTPVPELGPTAAMTIEPVSESAVPTTTLTTPADDVVVEPEPVNMEDEWALPTKNKGKKGKKGKKSKSSSGAITPAEAAPTPAEPEVVLQKAEKPATDKDIAIQDNTFVAEGSPTAVEMDSASRDDKLVTLPETAEPVAEPVPLLAEAMADDSLSKEAEKVFEDDEWALPSKKKNKKGKKSKSSSGIMTPVNEPSISEQQEPKSSEMMETLDTLDITPKPLESFEPFSQPEVVQVQEEVHAQQEAEAQAAPQAQKELAETSQPILESNNDNEEWDLPVKRKGKKGKKSKAGSGTMTPTPLDAQLDPVQTDVPSAPEKTSETQKIDAVAQISATGITTSTEPRNDDEWALAAKKKGKGKACEPTILSVTDLLSATDKPIVPTLVVGANERKSPEVSAMDDAKTSDAPGHILEAVVPLTTPQQTAHDDFSSEQSPKDTTCVPITDNTRSNQPTEPTASVEAILDDTQVVPTGKKDKKDKKDKKRKSGQVLLLDSPGKEPVTHDEPVSNPPETWDEDVANDQWGDDFSVPKPNKKKSKKPADVQAEPVTEAQTVDSTVEAHKSITTASVDDVWGDDAVMSKKDNQLQGTLSQETNSLAQDDKKKNAPPSAAAAAAGAIAGGVALLAEKFGGGKKKAKAKKFVDKRRPQEDDLFDDPILWEGADKKGVDGGKDAELHDDFWGGTGEGGAGGEGVKWDVKGDIPREVEDVKEVKEVKEDVKKGVKERVKEEVEGEVKKEVEEVKEEANEKVKRKDTPEPRLEATGSGEFKEALPTPMSSSFTESDGGWKETSKQGVPIDDEFAESPILGRGDSTPTTPKEPAGLLRRSAGMGEPVGGRFKERHDAEPIMRRMSSDSDFRRSPTRSLPAVQEVPEAEAVAAQYNWPTPDMNRDSGFAPGSPNPKARRSLTFQDEQQRDSGVHTEDYRDGRMHTPDVAAEKRLRRSTFATPVLQEPETVLVTPEPEKKSKRASKGYGEVSSLGGASPAATFASRAADKGITGSTDTTEVTGRRSVSDSPFDYGHKQRAAAGTTELSATATGAAGSPPRPERAVRRSVSNSSLARQRQRTPEPLKLRPESPGISDVQGVQGSILRSTPTPPLRRIDKRMSGDLRALRQQRSSNSLTTPTPTPTQVLPPPVANESRVRAKSDDKDMADVYDGYGEGRIGSPRSPTRPHSMRRRQSMQVLELESKVEQLIAENRLLTEARAHAEQNVSQKAASVLSDRDAEIESLKQSLQFLQNEVARLTEVNDGLTSANAELASKDSSRYTDMTRELDEARGAHTTFTQSLQDKDAEIADLRAQLEEAKEQIRQMQRKILESKAGDSDFLNLKDEDYFDHRCQQLCSHVQQWVLRFSKFSDMRACRLTSEINDEKTIDRLDNSVLDGSDVDTYLRDRVKRRDIFMSMTMNMIWEFVFTRYLFGMDREQRQKLKSLEKLLTDVGPAQAVRQWRAVTLTLLSRRPSFKDQRDLDTEAVVQAIFQTLCKILPPPSNLENQIQLQLRRVMHEAVDLSIEMRTQRAEYMMLPPLQPEYDADGELAATVSFDAAMMNERSGHVSATNEELEAQNAVVRVVLFPLVVKRGDDNGVGEDKIVVCPAQVLIVRDDRHGRLITPSSDAGGASLGAPSRISVVTESMGLPEAHYLEGGI